MSGAIRATTAARLAAGRTAPGQEGRPAASPLRVHRPAPARSRRRGLAAVVGALLLVGAALVAVAGATAVLAAEQVRLDALRSQVTVALSREQDLELERAQLLAPSRIVAIAEGSLHMVEPATVSYLAPVDPGPSVAEVEAREAGAAAAPPRAEAASSARGGRSGRRRGAGEAGAGAPPRR